MVVEKKNHLSEILNTGQVIVVTVLEYINAARYTMREERRKRTVLLGTNVPIIVWVSPGEKLLLEVAP